MLACQVWDVLWRSSTGHTSLVAPYAVTHDGTTTWGTRAAALEDKDAIVRILVTCASRHGATDAIGDRIADTLSDHGFAVTRTIPDDVIDIDSFDGVIIGSAVYMGRWMSAARDFVERFAAWLVARPVWLFSSGPIGDPPRPTEPATDVPAMLEASQARSHEVFAGRLERSLLTAPERMVVRALRVPERDDRDWDAIDAWADAIASEMRQPTR